jgi:cation transport ATPase
MVIQARLSHDSALARLISLTRCVGGTSRGVRSGVADAKRAAAVEASSEHPVGAAIVAGARAKNVSFPPATEFASSAGHGVAASVDGTFVTVGRRKLMSDSGLAMAGGLERATNRWEARGLTAVFAGWEGRVRGALAVGDTLKPNARTRSARFTSWAPASQ